MADRYWVGGTGNWNATSTTNWSASSGGASGASAPTSADNVIFDINSNIGTGNFTVTVTGTAAAPARCDNLTVTGTLDGNMTLAIDFNQVLSISGSLSLPASRFISGGSTFGTINFVATTNKTITTNGNSLNPAIVFDGVGGQWTLAGAFTTFSSLTVTNGTFITSNNTLSCSTLVSSNTNVRSIQLGSSTVSVTGGSINFATSTNLTFTAGTSTINCTSNTTLNGGGVTFATVNFTSSSTGTHTITGANTFSNLSVTSISSGVGIRELVLSANQTVTGTLTLGAANLAFRRIFVRSDNVGTQRTITLNGTLATLADIDFRDINAAGTVSRPWTGTRIGNCLGNANITFTAAKTVYWNLAGTQNWTATGWATTNNGTPAVNNFPLAQDTATFTQAGAAGTITIDANWNIGSIQMADGISNRSTTLTLASSTNFPAFYGNVTLSLGALTTTGTQWLFIGQGTTQTFKSNGKSLSQTITLNSPSGTFQLLDNASFGNFSFNSIGFSLIQGTLSLNDFILSLYTFGSNYTLTRAISFGTTGAISLFGANNIYLWYIDNISSLTITGTPTVNCSNSGSGARAIRHQGGGASNSISINVTTGGDFFYIDSNSYIRNFNLTGFNGTWQNLYPLFIAGNLILNSTHGIQTNGSTITFNGSAGTTQQINVFNKTLNSPIVQDNAGATVQLLTTFTQFSYPYTLTAGTLDLNGFLLTCTNFNTSNSNTRSIAFGSSGSGRLIVYFSTFNATTATNLTTSGTGAIRFQGSGTFNGGGGTYKDLECDNALTITGSNTFTDITTISGGTPNIMFTAGTTQTVSAFTAGGETNVTTLRSSVTGSKFTLSKSSGVVAVTKCQISDSYATGGAVWKAPEVQGNINTGTNFGWSFGNELIPLLF